MARQTQSAPSRVFEANDAIREQVPLLVGLMGPSGGGKTFSALRLATGIQRVTGGDIYGVDTEARRMLHYADRFRFKHVPFGAPFGSVDYLEVLRFCVAKGAKTIVVDSMSHEHEGPGGLIDLHEQELDRLAGSDWSKREKMNMLAWSAPKAARRKLINGILQLPANFIFCFRAKQSAKPGKNAEGKSVVIPQGFVPIAGEEFVFEQTLCALLLPGASGVPTWDSDLPGERMMTKLPLQFRDLFARSRALDEDTGEKMAVWARGGATPRAPAVQDRTDEAPPASEDGDDFGEPAKTTDEHDADLTEAAKGGMKALETHWRKLPKHVRTALKTALERRHKPTAAAADAAAQPRSEEAA